MSQAGILSVGGSTPGVVDTLSGNSGGAVGPDASHNINIVAVNTNTVVGNAGTNTLTITPTSSGYPITPYVVGPVGFAGYQTVQSAVNAASSAGGGIVYIQPGTYNENITFPNGITELVGAVGQEDLGNIVLNGQHTVPASGSICVRGMMLKNTTDLFVGSSSSSGEITILECTFNITGSGWSFNLPNWTGQININNCGDSSVTNGVLNNSGGVSLYANNCQIGAGTANAYTANGGFKFDLCFCVCPINISGGNMIGLLSAFGNTLTVTGATTGTLWLADFITGVNTALVMSSSGAITISNATINSTNATAIAGAGAGILTLGDVFFVNSKIISPTLTIGTTGGSYPGGVLGTAGNVLTSNGPGVVPTFKPISSDGAITSIVGNSGGAQVPLTGTFNVVGTGSITTVGTANTETVQLTGLTNHSLLVGAGTATITKLGVATNGQLPIGSVGADPVLASLTAGTGVSVVNGAGSITINSVGGGLTWTDNSGTFNAAVNTGYFISAAATPTLPASPSEGDTVAFVVDTASTCTVTGNTGQLIRIGSALSASAGTAVNSARGDSVVFTYRSSGTTWFAVGAPQGTWAVT